MKEQKSQRERGSEDKSIAMEEERPNDERMNEECQPEENSQGTMRNNGQFSKWKFYQEMMTKFQEIDRLKEAHQSEISKLNQENGKIITSYVLGDFICFSRGSKS